MAPAERPWLRLYSETTRDRKLRRMKPDHRWLWVAILCMAGTSRVRGTLLVGSSPAQVADIADEAALSVAKVKTGLGELEAAGMIEHVEGCWRITRWADRQFETPENSTRRVALFRDPELRQRIRDRDGDLCRYCGRDVDWKDRRGANGGTYDHVDPRKPNDFENLVVACRSCNARKGRRLPAEARMVLLLPGSKSDLDRDLDPSTSPESESESEGNSSVNSCNPRAAEPVDNEDDEFRATQVLTHLAEQRMTTQPGIRDRNRYRATVLTELHTEHHDRLLGLIRTHPLAPLDVLAGAILGEPNSLRQYRQEATA